MSKRLELQQLLENILGSRNVYFQPPESIKLSFPAIIYKRSSSFDTFADDLRYRNKIQYMVTVIDKNPDSNITGRVMEIPMTTLSRSYVANNLNHDVFTLYY